MHNVLIIGGAGFIGQNLAHAWRAVRPDDRLVVADAMTYAANIRSLESLIANGSIVFAKGDIRDAGSVRALFDEHKSDRVLHLAAESRADRSILDLEGIPPDQRARHVHPAQGCPRCLARIRRDAACALSPHLDR
ncbi:GDP-mannose 4,6-dehydratase [Bradyrhizobium sp. GCM10023182]|uniref:GDP-mannose 4,6-dehydratase n=1 Tax=Bradyrhizobium zhengyangense TaxID=2911009 RepID=A0ABS9LX48_9BRAD|nr:GDP-mannose 4,6-dehydratase [Bradyrhizobium zhengyangense]MCG2671590.1 GDP-mannose 4,6-dehydratase [Bradyrhizobium zhengyangense]